MKFENIKSLLNKHNFNFYYLDSVESTMSEIKKLNFEKNVCLMANEQTKGIGRRGSKWVSPKGNVYISILLKNEIDLQNHFLNNAYTTNIICEVIEKICKIKTKIKWPNDILINDKKIAGIISEIYNKNSNYLINTGFGINVLSSPIIDDYPTTNINEYNLEINNFDFTYELMKQYLKKFYMLKNLSNSIMAEYKQRLKFIGDIIKLKLNENVLKEGIFYDLNNDGSIKLKSNLGLENIYNARIIK